MVINSWRDVLSIGTAERASAEVGNNRAAIGNANDDDLVVGRIASTAFVEEILGLRMTADADAKSAAAVRGCYLDNAVMNLRITSHVSPGRCGRVAEGGGLLNR